MRIAIIFFVSQQCFDHGQTMDSKELNVDISIVAGAIADPTRSRMLCCLMDGRARTSTELALIGEVTPSTASSHITKLKARSLVTEVIQGRHRYFQLADEQVAHALEALMVISESSLRKYEPNTPKSLRAARTCYDHMAGTFAVELHDRLIDLDWVTKTSKKKSSYQLTDFGVVSLNALGVETSLPPASRRALVCACLDWSERRFHLGGTIGAALLTFFLNNKWVTKDLNSRSLSITKRGYAGLESYFGISSNQSPRS